MLGKLGTTEVLILIVFLVGIPVGIYFIGRASGKRKAELDMYRKKEKEKEKESEQN